MNKNSTLAWDVNAVTKAAWQAARAGDQVLLDYYGHLKHVSEKHLAGLVSEADVASEAVIRGILMQALPIQFLGEESTGNKKVKAPTSGEWWIVDPLDGTTNYVHQFPIFCISIGLMWSGRLEFGLVSVPKLGLTYTAVRGQGAYVNGQPLQVSSRKTLSESLLATGFFNDQSDALKMQIEIFTKLVYEARGIRRAGAAAFDLCLVAEGVFDAFWEKHLQPWDTAAGAVIVEEAGGRVSNYAGQSFTVGSDSILATNGHLHDSILKTMSQCQQVNKNRA